MVNMLRDPKGKLLQFSRPFLPYAATARMPMVGGRKEVGIR